MPSSHTAQHTDASEMSEQESADLFDGICRRTMRITGAEFLASWDAGLYSGVDVDSVPGLADVAAVIPLVRDI